MKLNKTLVTITIGIFYSLVATVVYGLDMKDFSVVDTNLNFQVERHEEKLPPIVGVLNSGGRLDLLDQIGSIVISAANSDTIEVLATKRVTIIRAFGVQQSPEELLAMLDVEAVLNPDQASVVSIFPVTTPFGVSFAIDYEIKVPNQLALNIENQVGRIAITDIAGSKNVEQETGSIEVAAPAPAQTDRLNLVSSTGSIILRLPEESQFDMNASVIIGAIDVDTFPLIAKPVNFIGKKVVGSVNGGGSAIRVELQVGQIQLNAN